MKCEKPLSELHRQYSAKELSKKDFEAGIFQHLIDKREGFHLFNGNPDRWNDFISWLYSRLSRAIELYRDMGSSFDAYISSLVYSAAKEYRLRESDHHLTEYTCWRAKAEEMMLYESEPEYLASEPEYPENAKTIAIPADINRRQIFFLLLKSYADVSTEFVKKVTKAIGMDTDTVQKLIDELRNLRSGKEAQIHDLSDRLHCQHYRCLSYEQRMQNSQGGTEYHNRMKCRYERARKRYDTMKKRLGGMRRAASNRMIAELLGIPRGTVDSSLSAIKNRMALKPDIT